MSKRTIPSNAVGRRRLLKLADLLEADASNRHGIKFDMSRWGEVDELDKPLSCGTTACAMGLAALSGAFKQAGLTAHIPWAGAMIDFEWKGSKLNGGIYPARQLFHITEDEAEWLFYEDHYADSSLYGAKGERVVAKRIRDFVAGKKRPPEPQSIV